MSSNTANTPNGSNNNSDRKMVPLRSGILDKPLIRPKTEVRSARTRTRSSGRGHCMYVCVVIVIVVSNRDVYDRYHSVHLHSYSLN